MKKLLTTFFALGFFIVANAQQSPAPQQDTTLQQYTGKYKFPEGSIVTEVSITIENGLLHASSVMGGSELKKTGDDVFEIVSFSGVATFKRTDGKVTGLKIEVGDTILEGTKEDSYTNTHLRLFAGGF